MVNPLLSTAALWPLEYALDQLINSDQHMKSTVLKFDGKLLEINADSPSSCLCLTFTGSHIRLSALSAKQQNATPSACVRGKTSVLLGLLYSSANTNALANPQLTIEGDASFVHELFNSISKLDLRWDDLIAPWFGDLATHTAKAASDNIKQWTDQAGHSLNNSVRDYLTEESNTLPTQSQAEQFSGRLDQLKLRIDRAEARAQQLNKFLV
ncbi:MAG: SCP2 domain-containing protein [Pseudohongiellaceae bacterium]